MKKLQTHGLLRLTAFVLAVSFVCMGDGEACGDTSGKKKYVIEKDSLGRLIVAWAEDSMKELQISIDGGPARVISLPTQASYSPQMHVTEAGDIIVVWSAIDNGKDNLSLYMASLPFGGKWSKPACISGDDSVAPGTFRLIVAKDNEINVYWESPTYFPSTANPGLLAYKKELHFVSGTMDSFEEKPKTLAILQHNDF